MDGNLERACVRRETNPWYSPFSCFAFTYRASNYFLCMESSSYSCSQFPIQGDSKPNCWVRFNCVNSDCSNWSLTPCHCDGVHWTQPEAQCRVGRGAGALGARAAKSGAPCWGAGRCKISGALRFKTALSFQSIKPAYRSSQPFCTTQEKMWTVA